MRWAAAARPLATACAGLALLSLTACGEGGSDLEPLESIQRLPPVLTSVEPNTAASGDTVRITGRLLNGDNPALTIDEFFSLADEDLVTATSALVVIPENIEPGTYSLRFVANGRTSAESLPFTIRRGISSLNPDTAWASQEVVITGTYTTGANNNQLSITPLSGGAPISLPVQSVSGSQLVTIIPNTLAPGRYRAQVRDTRTNETLTTRSILDVQLPGANDIYLSGDVTPSPTPGRYRLTVANGTDSTHHYNVVLVRPQANATSVIGLSATIHSTARTGNNAIVEFSAPTGIVPGSYRVRLVYSNEPLEGDDDPTITVAFWAPTSLSL